MKAIRKFFSNLKAILGLPAEFEQYRVSKEAQLTTLTSQVQVLTARISSLEGIIRERTEVHADIHHKGSPNVCIAVGSFRGRTFIQTFQMSNQDFGEVVDRLLHMSRHAKIGRIDAPPMMSLCIEQELSHLGVETFESRHRKDRRKN